MGRIKSPGLFKRKGIWHIDKQVDGQRLRESTGSAELAEAERYLVKRIQEIREAVIYGIRPKRTFRQAADKYLKENQHKASLEDDRRHLRQLEPFIGNLLLEQVHNGTLQSFIKARQQQGRKTKSINIALGVVRHILNLAATEWLDENSLTWLHSAPKIKLLKVMDARRPYPLSWEEQDRLFAELPSHLQEMALFKVNTGCREQEVCRLRWDWELDVELAEGKTSLFLIPQHLVKNRKERIVVLNDIAKSVIENRRGKHPHYVFTYQNHHLSAMNNSAWQRARAAVGLRQVRVHDLKHTFGSRLRAAGVSFEDRQDLLGHIPDHRSVTRLYSAANLSKLIEAANKVCKRDSTGSVLNLIRGNAWENKTSKPNPHKIPTLTQDEKKAVTA